MKRDACPICDKPAVPEYRPFCSRGCKDRDLLQWLGEGYRIPGEAIDPDTQSGLDTAGSPD